MRRREFMKVLGSTLATWPLAVRAQQIEPLRHVEQLRGFNDFCECRWWGSFLANRREERTRCRFAHRSSRFSCDSNRTADVGCHAPPRGVSLLVQLSRYSANA
jgi:hypothetical protein